MERVETLVIGASMAGLACAGCLAKAGREYLVIEKHDQVATPWRNHYERLHLHTHKDLSHLPHKPYSPGLPRYPSRRQVVVYLEDYCREFAIQPRFGCEARAIRRAGEDWVVATTDGTFRARFLILATGAFGQPRAIDFPGRETFSGPIVHSSQYRTGRKYTDQRVLVVGFGNSACEIALDLHEQGARPALSVRSPVNVLPRDILGIPVLKLGLLMNFLPPRLADRLNAPVVDLLVGNLSRLGLRKLPYGPMEQIHTYQKVPLLDIGTLQLIRDGDCPVYGAIERIDGSVVHFADGQRAEFDAIVAAIGYRKNTLQDVLDLNAERRADLNLPVDKQRFFGKEGLYFCGFYVSPTGQIREIGLDAQKIVAHLSRQSAPTGYPLTPQRSTPNVRQ